MHKSKVRRHCPGGNKTTGKINSVRVNKKMADTESLENISSLLNLSETLKAVGGILLNQNFDEKNFCFTSVATDSRQVVEKSLFVPLIGENQDGHAYVPQAVGAGASAVFISKYTDVKTLEELTSLAQQYKNVAFILVENTMHALQNAAGEYAGKFPGLIRCAITGSSGKTTTKEITASILRQKFSVAATEGNYNSETGLPLSVFKIRKEHELGLFEMGMNRVDEIKEIAGVFKPEYSIITNIGTAHIGILGSRENIAREKKNVFNHIDKDGCAFIPEADDYRDFLSEGLSGNVVYYGEHSNERIKFISDDGLDGTTFSVDGVEIHLALPGHYNYINALGAISLSLKLGVTPLQIKAGIESLKIPGGRSALRKGKYTILEDCYNANPDSMAKALELCSATKNTGKKIYVLGDMLELGDMSEEEHRECGKKAVHCNADLLIFFGNEMEKAYEAALEVLNRKESLTEGKLPFLRVVYVSGKDEEAVNSCASTIKDFASSGDFILLKGSRGMGLERLIPVLEGL